MQYVAVLAGASYFHQGFDLATYTNFLDSEVNFSTAIMASKSQNALEFEFGVVGEELELSDDESLLSQVVVQAAKVEIQVLQKVNIVSWREDKSGQFQNFLKELLRELQPRNEDHEARLNIVARLAFVLDVMNSFRGATLSTFGSFESNLYTRWADLDLSLELPDRSTLVQPISKKVKVRVLNALSRTLTRKGEARKVQFIPHARVPLITFEDSQHCISCDVSVENDTAIVKSRTMRWLCEVDSRCRDLILLVKFWAKAHDINDPKLGTFNSFALCLLVIFHLQTRSPPLLPPLKSVLIEDIGKRLKGCENLTEEVSKGCWEKIQPFIGNNFGTQNKSTVAELFASFINQFSSVKELWSQGLAVCTFNGAWGDRSSTCGKWRNKRYMIAIEDPFDRTENCARSVHQKTFDLIVRVFTSTADAIFRGPIDTGMPSLLESVFHWPADKQDLGLQAWLSKVLSKDEKYRQEELKFRTVQAVQYRQRQFYDRKDISMDTSVNNTFEAQFYNHLQLNDPSPPVLKKRKKKKKFSRGIPTVTGDVGLGGNSQELELGEQNSHNFKTVVRNRPRVTGKPMSTREGISPAAVDCQVESNSLSKAYAKISLLPVQKNTRQTNNLVTLERYQIREGSRMQNPAAHELLQSTMNFESSYGPLPETEASPAIERPSTDCVAMGSAESSGFSLSQAPSTFAKKNCYTSAMNENKVRSKFRKGAPTLSPGAGAPKLGSDIIVRNEDSMEPSTLYGAKPRVVQGEKGFKSRQAYSRTQVWMPRKMDSKFTDLPSASEGQEKSV
ncbi:hypothetical protein L7F22_041731 [Adiantum nelumboides]|nr:hypothetical protein [Adiantum nelumboides]